jgi:hypothetical protein
MRGRFLLGAAVAALALTVGCDGGASRVESSDGAGASASSRAPSNTSDAAVAAYLEMWEDAAVASHTSDVDHPRLDDHAADEALTLLKFVMEGHAEDGHVARGGPRHDVDIVDSSPARRELRDCMDDTGWLMYDGDGELVNDVPGSHRRVDATVELRGDRWLVSDLFLHGAATC